MNHTSPASLRINGFSIYQMKRTNIIRIQEVNSNCNYPIQNGDVILKINDRSIDDWNFQNLSTFICLNKIDSIETIEYFGYKRNKSQQRDNILITAPNCKKRRRLNTIVSTNSTDTVQPIIEPNIIGMNFESQLISEPNTDSCDLVIAIC